MSLTQAETVFGSVREQGLNDLLQAFFTARPRHLNYGTPAFFPATTAAATSITAPVFPGVGAIQFAIQFSVPTVDITPDSSGGTSPLQPGPGQFTLKITATLLFLCGGQQSTTGAGGGGAVLQSQLTVYALAKLLATGTLVLIRDRQIEPETVEIVVGQTVFFAVEKAPGISITDRRLQTAQPKPIR